MLAKVFREEKEAMKKAVKYLEELIQYVQDGFPYEIRATSVLMVHSKEKFEIKLIDLASMTKYEDES